MKHANRPSPGNLPNSPPNSSGRGSSSIGAWQNLKTAYKILAGFSLALVALIAVGVLGLSELKENQERLNYLVEDSVYATGLAGNMDARVQKVRYLSRKLTTYDDKSRTPEIDQALTAIFGKFKEAFNAFQKTDTEGFEEIIRDIERELPIVDNAIQKIRETVKNKDYQQAETMIDQILTGPADRLDDAVTRLEATQQKVSARVAKEAQEEYEGARLKIILLILLSSGLSVASAFMIARTIVTPLNKAVGALQEVAEGHLDTYLDVRSEDEVGQMAGQLNHVLNNLRTAMSDVGTNALAVAAASEQLTATASEIQHGSCQSATRLAEVASSSDDLSASVQSIAAALEEMDASIREISHSAADATAVASRAVAVSRTAKETVHQLGASSNEIGNVVQVISEIAAQTNLLALNATIESARAGESGKGFAVVAGEVKDLAQETSKATDQIRERVSQIQSDAVQAIESIEQISEIVQQINERQGQIASAVEEQTATTREMSRTVAQGAANSDQIASEVSSIAVSAQEAKAGAEASSNAACEVAQMAAAVQNSIGRFRY